MPSSLVAELCEDRHLVEQNWTCRSGVARSRSLSTVIGITCARDAVGLDSHHATFRRDCRCLIGDLLDCCAAAGVHGPRQSDDSARAGMLQAYGPDVRFGEHAAVALLLQDGSSSGHNNGCDPQPAASSDIASCCGSACSDIAQLLGPVSQKHSSPSANRIPT
jgi:hypothetical protein